MKIFVIEPDVVIGEDVLACLNDHFSPEENLLRASLAEATDAINSLRKGDLLVVSTTRDDLRDAGLLSRIATVEFALLMLDTDDTAKPRHSDPWHRIPKPFSEKMLLQGANAALNKRDALLKSA